MKITIQIGVSIERRQTVGYVDVEVAVVETREKFRKKCLELGFLSRKIVALALKMLHETEFKYWS